jgi:hypothetical protein
MALETMREEKPEAAVPGGVELESGAIGAQIEMLALVDVNGHEVEARACAAIRGALDAQEGAEPRIAGFDQAGEKITRRSRRRRGEEAEREDRRAERAARFPARAPYCRWMVDESGPGVRESRGILI